MCGILGQIGGKLNENLFLRNLGYLAHRGPDHQGHWQGKNILLGHRRLSIIDLSENANQPMELLGRYVITFNGEIYNYKEIREELKKHNIRFKSNSDTEVLLYAYIQYGVEFLHKLNGMWALAIWDRQEQSLFLSRDRLGKKPLFYSFLMSDSFVFASEMKGIYPFLNNIEIDHDTIELAKKNHFTYEATERCLIKNILRFPAGSFGIFKNRKLQITKYWNPLAHKIAIPKRYEQQVEMFRDLFINSCKIRMRSDVPLASSLSGGIDSSSVTCMMNQIVSGNRNTNNPNGQHAFVATFPGTSLDESAYARSVIDYLGINATFVKIDPMKRLDKIFYDAYMFEEIYYAPTIPFVQLYSQMKEKNIKVSIEGHGADELFAGYSFDFDSALIDALPNGFNYMRIYRMMKKADPLKTHHFLNRLNFSLINRYKSIRKFSKNPVFLEKIEGLDFLNSRLYENTYLTILPTLLRNYDRYSMMNGVELRMPFLDYRILNFAFSIPYSSKIRKGYTKSIVRDALKGIVPEMVLKRKDKIGFNAPMQEWVKRKDFKEWLSDEIQSQDFINSEVIEPDDVRKSIQSLINGEAVGFSNNARLFQKITPYFWEKALKLFAK